MGRVDENDDDVTVRGGGSHSVVDVHNNEDSAQAVPRTPVKSADYKDVGYSWVIVGAVTFNYFLVGMGLGSLGVLYPHFVDHFQCTQYQAGWIGSLHMAVGALIGLLLAPLIARVQSRPIAVIGSVIGSAGYASSYLATSVELMYCTFGLFGGIGNGMLMYSSTVALQQYFDRRRTLATALASTGFGLSPLAIAPLTRLMVAHLGWRLAVVILGCGYMHGTIGGTLLRPVPRSPVRDKPEVVEQEVVKGSADKGEHIDLKTGSNNGHNGTSNDVTQSDQSRGKTGCCRRQGAADRAIDLSLLIDIKFVVFTLSSSLQMFGYFVPYVFLPSHVQFSSLRLDAATAAGLIAILAISMLIGRVISGVVGDRMARCVARCPFPRCFADRRLFHYALPMILAGLANASVPIWTSRSAITGYSVAVGFLTGAYMVVQQPVLIDLLGMSRFAKAFAMFMLFNGLSALACQPFSGRLADVSGSFSLPFIVCGLMQASGGVLLVMLGVARSTCLKSTTISD